MKYRSIRLIISFVTLLTFSLTFLCVSVCAEGEEYLCVKTEVEDIGGKLSEDTSFLITFARKDEEDTISPLPDKTQTILKAGEKDEFKFERAAFIEPGDYLYTMKQEKETGDDNVITEEVTYTVTVRVVNGNAGLDATVDIRKDGQNGKYESAIFRNNNKRALINHSYQDNLNDYGLYPPGTGEAFPYLPIGLLGLAVLLGAWSIGRSVKAASDQKEGKGQ